MRTTHFAIAIVGVLLLAFGAHAQWYVAKPLRNVTNYHSVLNEIEARMPAQHIYRDSDRVGHTHETTHGLNSRLRNKWGSTGTINCAYFAGTGGQFILLREPRVTLRQIASRVPTNLRRDSYGGIYNTYLIQMQSHWNNQPLYVLDELSSYYNGTLYCMETGGNRHGTRLHLSTEATLEFLYYAHILVELTPESYPDKDKLREAVRSTNVLVYKNIVSPSHKRGFLAPSNLRWWELCQKKSAQK